MSSYLNVSSLQITYSSGCCVGPYAFEVVQGELVAVVGPSGAGKTTLLRILAGLVQPDHGQVILDQNVLSDDKTFLPPNKRRVGLVFQDYVLFPHLTVEQNIAFAFKVIGQPFSAEEIEMRLHKVRLKGMLKRYPHELSGGQQQRVALIRALAAEPKLLLMDEPFASLDAQLRDDVILETMDTLRQLKMTSLIVTHNPQELEAHVDRVLDLSCENF